MNANNAVVAEDHAWVDEARVREQLASVTGDPVRVREAIARALELHGLDAADVAELLCCRDPELQAMVFDAARQVKQAIYGRRLVLFAPLYLSNRCVNECSYCAFRVGHDATRITLTREQIAAEVHQLVRSGHRRLLLVAGEEPGPGSLRRLIEAIETVYSTRDGNGEIRRVNVNVAPQSSEGFRALRAAGIGTYQLFQETFHRPTYERVHLRGPKADYHGRLAAIGRAVDAGIDDVGIGVLFGLYDARFEVLSLLQFIRALEQRFDVGPHTISVPRLEPAAGSALAAHPPHVVSDEQFRTVVAVLRLAVPYTGIIMSTRETPQIRAQTCLLGVSQISAGSRTEPGGYSRSGAASAQFELGDHRSLDEVIRGVVGLGFIPSFCTACYRRGRTGADFMDLARPGLIQRYCQPNALLTFQEYLEDHASALTCRAAEASAAEHLAAVQGARRRMETERRLGMIKEGARDLYF